MKKGANLKESLSKALDAAQADPKEVKERSETFWELVTDGQTVKNALIAALHGTPDSESGIEAFNDSMEEKVPVVAPEAESKKEAKPGFIESRLGTHWKKIAFGIIALIMLTFFFPPPKPFWLVVVPGALWITTVIFARRKKDSRWPSRLLGATTGILMLALMVGTVLHIGSGYLANNSESAYTDKVTNEEQTPHPTEPARFFPTPTPKG